MTRILLPESASLVAGAARAVLLTEDGELLQLAPGEAASMLRSMAPPLVVHAPSTFRRLGMQGVACLDLLELFAFVLPGRAAAPTPKGLALALDMSPPESADRACGALLDIASALLSRLAAGRELPMNREAAGLAARMGQAGWGWAPFVLDALGKPDAAGSDEGYKVWQRLAEWEETAPLPPPGSLAVSPGEARTRLAEMLGAGAEQRPGQSEYAAAASAAFAPREVRGDPHLVLAEAGTGTGKTLGYIAPASLWAERNHGAVWISTYTRHLQRQVEGELARLIPDPVERRRRAVVRKGRENFLCLLNMQDAVGGAGRGPSAISLGLIARWAAVTADGDIQGGDLPGWFTELFGHGITAQLADRRGECLFSGCEHYKKCFIEHGIRRARAADLVVANHALVMAQAAWGGLDDDSVPSRYVFDEGHHIFDAADGAFAAEISGAETAELRRWLLGAEGGRSRARGLSRRVEDLVAADPDLMAPLDAALLAARALPAGGWAQRLGEASANPTEAFLHAARTQVLARTGEEGGRMDLEADLHPAPEELREAATTLARAFARLAEPLKALHDRLLARLETDADELEEAAKLRIEAVGRSLRRRALDPLSAWGAMLGAVHAPPPAPGERPEHVLFLRLSRRNGEDSDVALLRHWLDPTIPFATILARPAQGMLVTSATLRDGGTADAEHAWDEAEARTGASHLPSPAIRVAVPSPFDYAAQTRVYIATDVNARDIASLAGAYRALFLASGGGGLGLFTAIARLRAVHARIAPALEEAGIPLFAQHIDAMDNATLVDVFRTETDACLLGTDAMRDGVDVPGRALRLVVFERTPWPRPDILHRERRVHLSNGNPTAYDDRIARLRLRQGFGRLIRSGGDRGVFVLLDRQTPSRLLSAFPPGCAPERLGLAEIVRRSAEFLGSK